MRDENQADRANDAGAVTRTISDCKAYARMRRQAGDLEAAGMYYVAGAHGSLLQFRRVPDGLTDVDTVPPPRLHEFGSAIRYLLLGALCFRLEEKAIRCRYHCEQGEAIVSDILEESIFTTDAQIGLCHEVRGDFRLVGNLCDHDQEYALAAARYEKVENDLGWSMESEFEDAIQIPLELAESVGMDVGEDRRNEIMYLSLNERIEYKRANYPEIIDAVVDAGNWESEVL